MFLIQSMFSQIIGSTELCHRISEGLHHNARERRWNISVHQCESIADVVKAKIDISVDFIIFASDLRTVYTLSEVSLLLYIQSVHKCIFYNKSIHYKSMQ